MTPTCAAAQRYLERGFRPIPIPHGAKAPTLEGWPSLRLTAADLGRYFDGTPANIGLVLGDDYGTTDIDLDCAEAIGAAPELLPDTRMIFGRASKRASHYFFRADPPVKSRRYLDPISKACLVELRCQKSDGTIGLQTVVPPSEHPSGEAVTFEQGRDSHPANVEAAVLQDAVLKLAAASLLARHWPKPQGGRNAGFLALAGVLARAGWAFDDTLAFHRAIYRALWDGAADFGQCEAEVKATYERHGGHGQTTGIPTLRQYIDAKAVTAALTWLGIERQAAPAVSPKRGTDRECPHSLDMEVLMDDPNIRQPELAIEGLLPKVGLVLIGGRPKCGKSWLACQTGLAFVTGEALGGWLSVRKPGRVHLWALEDQYALTKDKVCKLLQGARPAGLKNLRVFAELAHPILRGGDEILRAALREHPAEVVLLDSLFKLTGGARADADISQRDYDTIDRVRKIGLEHQCCMAVYMHSKKGARGGDPIENLLGTSGITAAADVVGELSRTGFDGKLTVTGRVVPREDYQLRWHEGNEWGWSIIAQGSESGTGETQDEVLAFLEAQGAAKPQTIAAGCHKPFGAVWQALLRLQGRGLVLKGADRRWAKKP